MHVVSSVVKGPMRLSIACVLAMMLVMGACARARAVQAEGATFVVVRHAEKIDDGSRDPPLTARGAARAQALGRRFAGASLTAVYATAFRRTQQTAQPAATMHGIAVTTYDAVTPAVDFVANLRARHPRGTILVVGHSNTVPAMVAALCTCRIASLGEEDYDAIYTIHVNRDGRGVLDVGRQSSTSDASP